MSHEATGPDSRTPQTCYCFMWESHPEEFERQGIPRGYCGTCDVCGRPGHTRAHPDAPVTSAWCDACYMELSKSTPLWRVMRAAICVLLLAWIAYSLWRSVGQ